MLYLSFIVDVPDAVSAILESDNSELLKAYFYEFLSDYEELKYDYDINDDESDDA